MKYKSLLISVLPIWALLSACSSQPLSQPFSQPLNKTDPLKAETTTSNTFHVPAMSLKSVDTNIITELLKPKDSPLSIIYKGSALPSLSDAVFSTIDNQGIIRLSKNINGTNISKDILNIPVKADYFASDKQGEIYLITKQPKAYKFVPIN